MSVSGGYKGFSSSVSVDFGRFTASMTSGTSFGSEKVVFRCGSYFDVFLNDIRKDPH